MADNQDRAAPGAAWTRGVFDALRPEIDGCVAALQATAVEAGDIAAIEKRARAVGVIARAAKAVQALAEARPGSGGETDPAEDEMHSRDDSPENLERLRGRIESRLDRLHDRFREAGVVVEPGCWPTACDEREPLRPT